MFNFEESNSPLLYNEWVDLQRKSALGVSQSDYVVYLKNWYKERDLYFNKEKYSRRQEFIQLLKDLNFLFSGSEQNLFLRDLDYDKDEDLILAIPYFAARLKDISKLLNYKRESVKRAKSRYNLIGSNTGLEALLYDYVLKTFTKKEGKLTQLPSMELVSYFPDLSAVKNDFYIEVEELYDFKNYYDRDPVVPLSAYVESIEDQTPLSDKDTPFSAQEVLDIIATSFYPRVLENPLYQNFSGYLPEISVVPENAFYEDVLNREKWHSRNFLGETLYGISAIRLKEVLNPDYVLSATMEVGENWFMWPSGFQSLDSKTYNNYFEPVWLISSMFIESGATAGSDYTNSDLIFSDKNGVIEGAWLQGPRSIYTKGSAELEMIGMEITEFLFPYVGFELDSKTLQFSAHSLKQRDNRIFNALDKAVQQQLLQSYYTNSLPNSASESIYLNGTSLIEQGAVAGKFVEEADRLWLWDDLNLTLPEVKHNNGLGSFVYKFDRTELLVTAGELNNIYWPTQSSGSSVVLFADETTCAPVALASLDPSYTMTGCVAGLGPDSSDIIYKLSSKSDNQQIIEAAWLGASALSSLDVLNQDILVYKKPAVRCSDCLNGPIQSTFGANFKVKPNERITFVWTGPDTYADEIFKYHEHADNCKYKTEGPFNFYKNQDHINETPLSDRFYWKKCSCKATLFSPIGHKGKTASDFNGIADCLYADPNGLGSNFTFTNWRDTRDLNYKNSPQFAFFQLQQDANEGDSPVGFGPGRWVTGGTEANSYVGDRMVLKTGRAYTYYRSSLRKDVGTEAGLPMFVAQYIPAKHKMARFVPAMPDKPVDIVVIFDISRSQQFNFNQTKQVLIKLIENIDSSSNSNVQIGLLAFNKDVLNLNYLTKNWYDIQLNTITVEQNDSYPDYTTNLKAALEAAEIILTQNIPENYSKFQIQLQQLCRQLTSTIVEAGQLNKAINLPQTGADKRILVISDGATLGTNTETEDLKNLAASYKQRNIQIFGTNFGPLSLTNNLLKDVSFADDCYFDLERFLISGDGSIELFANYMARKLLGKVPSTPVWRKLNRNSYGSWERSDEISDMILNPGDSLMYNHRKFATSYNVDKQSQILTPSIDFNITVKLDGWDYSTHSFALSNVGREFGGKPFWATISKDILGNDGAVRFKNEYVLSQVPDPSSIVLKNGSYIQYQHLSPTNFKWIQPLDFEVKLTDTNWKKIELEKVYSNLEDLLKISKIDSLIQQTNASSDILLEGFSQYKPARYYYIARSKFDLSQDLFLRNRCVESFVEFVTGEVLTPIEPYANLANRLYPTIANVNFPSLMVTEKQVGGYLLPNKLGVSTYRGRGYTYSVSQNAVSAVDETFNERIFLDPLKYGSKSRGLTKKDQVFPLEQTLLDNKWIMEPFGSGAKAGVIIGTKENQKFTPYQTDYEILGYNPNGIARQQDSFQFWDYENDKLAWDLNTVTTNNLSEILPENYPDRINQLMANKGVMTVWKADLFGNDYGLYKHIPTDSTTDFTKVNKTGPVLQYVSEGAIINQDDYHVIAVRVSGSAPLSYQWYKDGKALRGANNASYVFYKAKSENSGKYVCEISNMVGKVSTNSILINVEAQQVQGNISPTITFHSSLNGNFTTPVVLSTLAVGSPTLAYQWYKEGLGAIPQQTSSSYQTSVDGVYYCEVSNSYGKAHTNLNRLTFNPEILFQTTQTGNYEIPQTLSATGAGIGNLVYQWFNNTQPIPGAILPSITVSTNGNYYCTVKNINGLASSKSCNITFNPKILSETSISGNYTTTQTLSVSAIGLAPLIYTWYRNGLELPRENQPYISASINGVYQCKVSNVNGFVLSKKNTLSFNSSIGCCDCTEYTLDWMPQGNFNSPITLCVSGIGVGPFRYQWFKGETPYKIEGDKPKSSLTVFSNGAYRCRVFNNNSSQFSPTANLTFNPFFLSSVANSGNYINPLVLTANVSSLVLPQSALAYQWYQNNTLVNGATSRTYTTSANGIYYCNATDSNGTTSSSIAELTFNPVIYVQPLGSLNYSIKPYVTSLSAGGMGLTYQWISNIGGVEDILLDMTTNTLSAYADAQYYCRVINSNSTIESTSIVVSFSS